MLKLNNEQAASAWEDYKEFHDIEIRFQHNIAKKTIEQAFKYAFALAMDAAERAAQQQEPEKKEYKAPPEMKGIPLPDETVNKTVKKGIKREFKGRITRTYEQRKKEAQLLVSFLRGAHDGYKALKDIVLFMNISGCNDWNGNNASGFVKDAMRQYPQIKRIGLGLYKYEDQ